jgi:iron complex outermembrane receptor protein
VAQTPADGAVGADPAAPSALPPAPNANQGDILVTARRKSEDILKTPVAIQALTSADIAARGIVSVQDLAQFVPGLNDVGAATGGARSDRSYQEVVIRGMTPSNSSSSQTTSFFIDGVPVSSATAIQSVNDPERVEVLKGPQSAYFGRETFAGAINIVTKMPTEELSGSVTGLAGTRSNYDVTGAISGPIFGDVLGFRVSARQYAKDGSYDNGGIPGQTLGDQKTRTATALLVLKPSSDITVKAFGMINLDNDGPSAQGLISAYDIKDANGNVVVKSQSNCTLTGVDSSGGSVSNPYICGVAPHLLSSQPSSTDINDSYIKNFLANPTNRLISPDKGVQGFGLRSRYYHLHLAADWRLGDSGVTLSSLTGLNRERKSEIADFANYYSLAIPNIYGTTGAPSYFSNPTLIEGINRDFSQEFRGSFENGGRFHATFGGSYLNNFAQSNGGGGNNLTVVTPFGATRARTFGAFYGLGFDVSSKFTVNVDGRYQIDKLYSYAAPGGTTLNSDVFAPAGFYPGGSTLAHETFRNFMPRVIAQYKITPTNMVYASFSKGVNPGTFNSQILTGSPAGQAAAAAAGYKIPVNPEKVTNYEIGAKGKLFDNRLRYTISIYDAIWTNQINEQAIEFFDASVGSVQQILADENTGKVRLRGVEADLIGYATPRLTIELNGAITDTHIDRATNSTVTALTGITNFRGKQDPYVSKYSGVASIQYTVPVRYADDASAYARIDVSYKSGSYSDIANVVRTPDSTQVNFRLGTKTRRVGIEAYVSNLFDNKAYYNISDAYAVTNDFSHFTYYSALVASLPDLRTVGLKMTYAF